MIEQGTEITKVKAKKTKKNMEEENMDKKQKHTTNVIKKTIKCYSTFNISIVQDGRISQISNITIWILAKSKKTPC